MPRGINVLCIDGGGVRGLSSLVLLGEIMGRLGELEGRYERPDPAEYFDVIAGSGTGGVSACMLGRLRMPMRQAMSAYTKLVSEVFSDKKTLWTSTASPYKGTKLQGALRSLVQDATGTQDDRMKEETETANACKTMIFATSKHNLNPSIPVMFRSYESAVNPAPDCTIWEVLYATMAHPDLFKSIDISDGAVQQSFVGGELGCSNPIVHVLSEVRRLYPDQHVSCILSIGAGHARTISLPDPSLPQVLLNIKEATTMKDMATDSERVAEEIAARFQDTTGVYYRFNVDQGMQDMNADDWEKLGEVMAHTRSYISKVEANRGIDQAAEAIKDRKPTILVKQLDGRIQVSLNEPVARIKHFPAPSSMFTGREDHIQQISSCVADPNHERRVCVIHGLGGAGKTQLALKTIERCQGHWSHTLFVDASSKQTVETELQNIATAKDAGKTHEDALMWLATSHEAWLLVYDNADDPSLGIQNYFPSGNRGSILITTRLTGMRLHARGPSSDCHLFQMSQEDSLALLLRLVGIQGAAATATEMEAAIALLEDLGHFALGIVQAGSYIAHSFMSISEYRQLFLVRRRTTLEQYMRLKVKVDNYQWSVFTTWKLCYDLLEESDNSRQLLWLLAFTHHDQITANMFERAAINLKVRRSLIPASTLETLAREYVQEFLSKFLDNDGNWDPLQFSNAIGALVSYSLLEYNRSNATYSIHVLVQEWVRTVIPQSPDLALECATSLLSHAVDWDNTVASHKFLLDLGLHVIKVLSGRHGTVSANHAHRFAKVYDTMGLWDNAEQLQLKVLEARKRTLGEDHPSTLTSMGNLASTYWNKGRWDDAEQLEVKVLEAHRRTLGEDHPDTLMSMGNLASTYRNKGQWDDAEQLEVKVLEAHRRMLGEDHPSTLTSMGNLASTYRSKGRWDDAEQLEVKVLEAHRRTLGEDHPDTLTSMGNLASTYRNKGRWDDAEQLEVKVMEARKRTLGEDHPHTLMSMGNLASTYRKKGRWDDAEQLEVKVMEARKRTLGEDHPHTLTSMSNLALTYRNKGRWGDAEQLQLKVLEARKRTLGEDHPRTLTSMGNLASTYRNKGRWDDAEQLEVKVLEARTRTLGKDHPDTLTGTHNLALTYADQGRWDEAEELLVQALEARARVIGEQHPDTVSSRECLADFQRRRSLRN